MTESQRIALDVYFLGVLTSPQPQATLSSAGIVFQASA
jgi:hypothetical protein